MTVLVTGGAGFIGSHVAAELLGRGHDVVVIDDLSGGRCDVPERAELVDGSVCDAELVNDVFRRHRFDYVFHLAAYAAEGLSHFIKRFNYTNNVIGSVNVLNAAVNAGSVRCFVFTSSIAVYGAAQVPMTEDTPPIPEDPYGIAKLAVEHELRATRSMFGLPYVIFRPHNVYGERQNIGDPYRNVIGIFMNRALSGEPFPIFGDGNQTRAFSYVGDVAPVIARSIEVPEAYDQIFNIGSGDAYTINELASTIADVMGVTLEVERLPERHEVRHAVAGHDKVQAVFGPQRVTPLREGIEAMAAWARDIGPQKGSAFGEIEIPHGLPPSWRRL